MRYVCHRNKTDRIRLVPSFWWFWSILNISIFFRYFWRYFFVGFLSHFVILFDARFSLLHFCLIASALVLRCFRTGFQFDSKTLFIKSVKCKRKQTSKRYTMLSSCLLSIEWASFTFNYSLCTKKNSGKYRNQTKIFLLKRNFISFRLYRIGSNLGHKVQKYRWLKFWWNNSIQIFFNMEKSIAFGIIYQC